MTVSDQLFKSQLEQTLRNQLIQRNQRINSSEVEKGQPSEKRKTFSLAQKIALVAAGIFGHVATVLVNIVALPLRLLPIQAIHTALEYGFHVSNGWIKSASQEFVHLPRLKKQMLFVLSLQYSLSKEAAGLWKPAHEIATVNGSRLVLSRIPIEGDNAIGKFQISKIAAFVEHFEAENTHCMDIMTEDELQKQGAQRKIYGVQDFTMPDKQSILSFCEDFLNPATTDNTLGHCKAGRARSALNFLAVIAIAGYFNRDRVSMNLADQKEEFPLAPKGFPRTETVDYLQKIYLQMKMIRPQIDLKERHFIHLAAILESAEKNGELAKFAAYLS